MKIFHSLDDLRSAHAAMRRRLVVSFFSITAILLAPTPFALAQSVKVSLTHPTTPAQAPEGFLNIQITSAGQVHNIKPTSAVACVPKDKQLRAETGLLQTKIAGFELAPSRCYFRSTTDTLLLFIGAPIEPDPGFALVLAIDATGVPKKLFEKSSFDVLAIRTVDDGTKQIIGRATTSEAIGCSNSDRSATASTYDPFAVYELHADIAPKYLPEASKTYNEQHYVWLGPHSREDYVVFLQASGHNKPFAVRKEKAGALLNCKP